VVISWFDSMRRHGHREIRILLTYGVSGGARGGFLGVGIVAFPLLRMSEEGRRE
jgi:hypothetical protein